MRAKPRVLVCGTNYGRFYLSAFTRPDCPFALAGIMASGSERSRALAREFEAPLYTSAAELPGGDIDLACVAVKSTLLGGAGTRIARELLERGIHVIQEHPLHPADLRECLDAARTLGLQYHINSNFVHTRAARIFADYMRKSRNHEEPLFIDLCTALPWSALDIVGHALGGLEPFALRAAEPPPGGPRETFKCLIGHIAGIPACLRIQHYFDPDDTLHNYLIMHRICIGAESGNLTLHAPFGPVIWTQGYPRTDGPEEAPADTVMGRHLADGRRAGVTPGTVRFTAGDAPSYADIFSRHWPEAILGALETLRRAAESGATPEGQSEGYLSALAALWVESMRLCGKPAAVARRARIRPEPDPAIYREHCLSLDIHADGGSICT